MAYRLGLKLWSVNTDYYYEEAKRLYSEGVFDYIELYVVPNTLDTLPRWKELEIPFIIHAPHPRAGNNSATPALSHILFPYPFPCHRQREFRFFRPCIDMDDPTDH